MVGVGVFGRAFRRNKLAPSAEAWQDGCEPAGKMVQATLDFRQEGNQIMDLGLQRERMKRLQLAPVENIDFRVIKLDKWQCCIRCGVGVRQGGLINSCRCCAYVEDSERNGRAQSGLKLSSEGS